MRYSVILFLLLTCTSVFAQNGAKDILDKSAAKIKAYPAVEIEFSLIMENKEEDIREEHQGKAYMKGSLYKLEVMDVVNYYDGKTSTPTCPKPRK